MNIDVYTPATPADRSLKPDITPGSGIVGTTHGDHLKIDYEGNQYDAVNIVTYADRCYQAADRQASNYPTRARALVNPTAMTLAGQLNTDTGVITLHDHDARQRVLAWTALTDTELDTQLLTTTHTHARAAR